MKKILFIAVALFAQSVIADEVKLNVIGFRSARVDNVSRITISLKADGVVQVVEDPNHCTTTGNDQYNCTTSSIKISEGRLTLVTNDRPSDADTLLKINDTYSLSIGSGFNREGKRTYTVLKQADSRDSDTPVARIEVLPEVDVSLAPTQK